MKNTAPALRLIVALLILSFSSLSARAGDEPIKLALTKGQTINHIVAVEQRGTATLQGKTYQDHKTWRLELTTAVTDVKPDGDIVLLTTFKRVKFRHETKAGLAGDFDSARNPQWKPALSLSQEDITNMAGKSVTVTVSPQARIKSVTGWEEEAKRILGESYYLPDQKAGVEKRLERNFIEHAQWALRGLVELSAKPVQPGESWESHIPSGENLFLAINPRATLLSNQNNEAVVSLTSDVEMDKAFSSIKMNAAEMSIQASGKLRGQVRLSAATGWPTSFEITREDTGRLVMKNSKGMSIPMEPPHEVKILSQFVEMPMHLKTTYRGWNVSPSG